jgi:hypothetical protein
VDFFAVTAQVRLWHKADVLRRLLSRPLLVLKPTVGEVRLAGLTPLPKALLVSVRGHLLLLLDHGGRFSLPREGQTVVGGET